ncbi:MAG TPA: FliH/SctL family protein [Kiloniellales bacterium]|nr:FliH/SctL family protein [Kiloniellales bacterium]
MAEKFLFNTAFDFETLGTDRRPKRPTPKYSEADLETARAEGYAAGREAGLEESRRALEHTVAQTLAALRERLQELIELERGSTERRDREALQAAVGVTRKLFPHLAGSRGLEEIEAIVRDCLERPRDEPRIVVRVADALLDTIQTRVTEEAARVGFEGRIVFLGQNDLGPGDVRVEWADGGAERDESRLWEEIDAALRRAIGGPPADGGEDATPPKNTTDFRPAAPDAIADSAVASA